MVKDIEDGLKRYNTWSSRAENRKNDIQGNDDSD